MASRYCLGVLHEISDIALLKNSLVIGCIGLRPSTGGKYGGRENVVNDVVVKELEQERTRFRLV